uniref:Uncharacterized protein n=1 Tax=Romanomermis culicivorax TaxID=13658 RepID=A0A915I3H1_ROMCU
MEAVEFLEDSDDVAHKIDVADFLRIHRYFADQTNPFECYKDQEFYIRYRFTNIYARRLIDLLYDGLQRPRNPLECPVQDCSFFGNTNHVANEEWSEVDIILDLIVL